MIFDRHDAENLQGAVVRLQNGEVVNLTGAEAFASICGWVTYYKAGRCVAYAKDGEETEETADWGHPLGIVEVLKWLPGHPLAEMTPERAVEILADGHPLEEVRQEAVECLRAKVLDDWIDIDEAEPFPGQLIMAVNGAASCPKWSTSHFRISSQCISPLSVDSESVKTSSIQGVLPWTSMNRSGSRHPLPSAWCHARMLWNRMDPIGWLVMAAPDLPMRDNHDAATATGEG